MASGKDNKTTTDDKYDTPSSHGVCRQYFSIYRKHSKQTTGE